MAVRLSSSRPLREAKMLCWRIFGDHVALGRGMLRVGILILTYGILTTPPPNDPTDGRGNRLLPPHRKAKMLCLSISGDHVAVGRSMLRIGILTLTSGILTIPPPSILILVWDNNLNGLRQDMLGVWIWGMDLMVGGMDFRCRCILV